MRSRRISEKSFAFRAGCVQGPKSLCHQTGIVDQVHDGQLASARPGVGELDLYSIQTLWFSRKGYSDDKVLQIMIDDMKRTTGRSASVISSRGIFDLSFVEEAVPSSERAAGKSTFRIDVFVRSASCSENRRPQSAYAIYLYKFLCSRHARASALWRSTLGGCLTSGMNTGSTKVSHGFSFRNHVVATSSRIISANRVHR